MPSQLKGIPIAPLTGLLDMRSMPDQLAPTSMRYRQNFQTPDENKIRRGCGWSKLLTKSGYNNQDFHDQLLTFTEGSAREPITYAKEVVSSRGVRSLFIGTQSRIARLNEYSGNWKLIGDGLGGGIGEDCNGPRWRSATLGDYVVFTNNFDRPKYHALEAPPDENGNLLHDIPDLEVIGLSKAAHVWEWRNVVFFADVEMDSERFSYRIVWSDYGKPLSNDPANTGSIAGSKDLNYGERILAGMPCGNVFMIYTNYGVWTMSVAAQPGRPFDFIQTYKGQDNGYIGCLAFENAIVSLGDVHLGMGPDRFYMYSPTQSVPEPLEWLHRSDIELYRDIDVSACKAHIGVFHNNEAIFSIQSLSSENGCPDRTLRINTRYKVVDIIDHGFTVFCPFRPQETMTIRDFIIDKAICTLEDLDASGYGFENEGLPAELPGPSAEFTPTVIHTHEVKAVDEDTDVEDYDQETSAEDSLCALLGGIRIDQICIKCESSALLVGASSADWCLKQIGGAFHRERCTNPTATGTTGEYGYTSSVGTYLLDGYDSIMRFAPMYLDGAMAICERFEIKYLASPQTPPSDLVLRVGDSGQIADPNDDECRLVWHALTNKKLKCISPRTVEQHLEKGSTPSQICEWRFLRQGRVLYLELKISGTGGDAVFSGAIADARATKIRNY